MGWDGHGFPNVGYSNFELDCVKSWTDHGQGSWKRNSGQDCSWPMLKIGVESWTEGTATYAGVRAVGVTDPADLCRATT